MKEDTLASFELDNISLQYGGQLSNANLVYATWGKLNAARDNAILFPTYYTGTHESNAAIIGNGRSLDPDKYFIIVPNMFGNGVSSSPSNMSGSQHGIHFPGVSILDNVRCQYKLLTEVFGIQKLPLLMGWSMGAIQTYQWAVSYPEFMDNILCICGSSRISPHNRVFLEGVKSALCADQTFNNGEYTSKPVAGLKAFGRVYAGWAYSQAFYRDALYKEQGFKNIEALLNFWEKDHLAWDANDLLSMLWSWQHADISKTPGMDGDFDKALASIKAHSVIMPCDTDLYFTVADNAYEAERIPDAVLRVIRSDWGHVAGGPGRVAAVSDLIDNTIEELLG